MYFSSTEPPGRLMRQTVDVEGKTVVPCATRTSLVAPAVALLGVSGFTSSKSQELIRNLTDFADQQTNSRFYRQGRIKASRTQLTYLVALYPQAVN